MSKRIIAILILVAMVFTACSESAETQKDTALEADAPIYDLPDESVPTQAADGESSDAPESLENTEQNEIDSGETQEISDPEISDAEPSSDENVSDTQDSTDVSDTQATNETEQSGTEPTETSQPVPSDSRIYEDYLAALTIVALSMEYFDFIPLGVFSYEKVSFDRKTESKGIYATFESEGSTWTAFVYPIEGERNESGTLDIYSTELGYAAFDLVESVPGGCTEIEQDVYAELLPELTGVSTFRR